jgi:hypothetical protein
MTLSAGQRPDHPEDVVAWGRGFGFALVAFLLAFGFAAALVVGLLL